MKRLLWIGDAACPSGFARATHYTLDTLKKYWEIEVLGVNYRGRPHDYPYKIYPAAEGNREDLLGMLQTPIRIDEFRPDVVVIQNDPWNVIRYFPDLRNVPVVATMAIDGKNCAYGRELNGLALAIFWTDFAAKVAINGGYRGPYAVVPLGVDQKIYKPMDRYKARESFFRPRDYEGLKDAFIVGNINRNQPRKRFDLQISFFAEWVKEYKVHDAYLHLHVAPTGDLGYDCHQLMAYYGLAHRLILSTPDVWKGIPEWRLAQNYNILDVVSNTSQGEGWGLTTMEAMASKIATIGGDQAALGEWTEDAMVKVKIAEIACTINNVNVIGGVLDRQDYIEKLNTLYTDKTLRDCYGQKGYDLVSRSEFRWDRIGERFNEAIDQALDFTGIQLRK